MMKVILVIVSLVILVAWYFVPPSTNLFNMVAGNEQSQISTVNPSVSSQQGGPNVAVETSAKRPISAAARTGDSFTRVASTSKSVERTRIERPALRFSDEAQADHEQGKGLAISGLVQDEKGNPLASIEVLAEPIGLSDADKWNGDSNLEATRSAWTDFDGSFYFGNLAADEYLIRTAPMDGFAAAETTARVGAKSANLVLVWLQDIRIYGTVSSTKGAPIEGVRIIAGPPTSVTDTGAKGEYELDLSVKEKSSPQTIHFRRPGYRDKSVQLTAAELDDLIAGFLLDVSMEPLKGLTTVAGRLEDPEGRPVIGKTLNLNSSRLRTRYHVQSDDSGHFSMEGVAPGNDYRLSVRPQADYRDYELTQLEVPAGGLELDIVLEPLNRGGLSGWMTDADGTPVPGFALTLLSEEATGQSVQVVGDHQGFFEVEDFPEGNVMLKTNSYPAFQIRGMRSTYEAEDPVLVVLDLGPHALRGRVTNGSGYPVAAPEVSLDWQRSENGVQNYSVRKTIADQNGNFVFTGLGSGVHTLRVHAPEFGAAVVNIDVGTHPNNIVVELGEKS